MNKSIRQDSTEHRSATVTTDHDLAGKTIEVALPRAGTTPSTYVAAEVTATSGSGDRWTATYRVLIGPEGGSFELAPGVYDWTVRITDSPEVPVFKAGQLQVTAT